MKKILSLVMACSIAITAFCAPGAKKFKQPLMAAWDIPLAVVKVKHQQAKKFDDPYVTSVGAFQIGTKVSPDYAINIQVALNTNPPVKWLVTVEVWGIWLPGQSTRDFDITFSTAQWFRSVTYPMNSAEEMSQQYYETYEGPF